VYLVWSACLALGSALGRLHPTEVVVHAIDVATFSGLMLFTGGTTSPFFVLLSFPLFAATLRWNWQRTLVTGVVLLAVYLVLVGLDVRLPNTDEELTRRIVRGGYLAIATVLLAYVSFVRQRSQQRLHRLVQLTEWPKEEITEHDTPPIGGALRHALRVLDAQRAFVLWEANDEPYQFEAVATHHGCEFSQGPPQVDDPVISPDLAQQAILVLDAEAGLFRTEGSRSQEHGRPLAAKFVARHRLRRAIVAPIQAEGLLGHLLLTEPSKITPDMLPMAKIVAARIGGEIQRHLLHRELLDNATLRERARLARDVHDGLLQALTAASMQVQAILADVPEALRSRTQDLGRIIVSQQRQLRTYVDDHRRSNLAELPFEIETEVGGAVQEFARYWGCEAEVRAEPAGAIVSRRIGRQILFLVSEALANAVRHAAATKVQILVTKRLDVLELVFRDNGEVHAADEKETRPEDVLLAISPPRSLQERIQELGGRIGFKRLSEGNELFLCIPL
jgi:signal transduction histidine kinase